MRAYVGINGRKVLMQESEQVIVWLSQDNDYRRRIPLNKCRSKTSLCLSIREFGFWNDESSQASLTSCTRKKFRRLLSRSNMRIQILIRLLDLAHDLSSVSWMSAKSGLEVERSGGKKGNCSSSTQDCTRFFWERFVLPLRFAAENCGRTLASMSWWNWSSKYRSRLIDAYLDDPCSYSIIDVGDLTYHSARVFGAQQSEELAYI